MASAQESFDAEKVRKEIFQTTNRDIVMTIMFVGEMVRILREKGRKNDFEFIADRSLEILQGNLLLKKIMLLLIADREQPREYEELLKYYLALEELLDDSIFEKNIRMDILLRLGNIYYNLGECRKAIDYHEKGLEISTEIGNRQAIASMNGNLGNTYSDLGEYEKAIYYHEKALEISTEIGDRLGIASINGNLGNVYDNLGEYQKAIYYHEKGLEINTEIGDRSGIATRYGNLGNAYNSLGEYQNAIDYYNKGLEISTEIGDKSGIANNNGNLGNAYRSLGEYQKAIDYCKKSLEINTEIGYRSGIATNTASLANAYVSLGEYQKAILFYKEAIDISTEIEDRSGIASNNGNLGNAYLNLGEYQKAIDYYNKSLEINTEIGDRSVIATNNGNLGNVYVNLGKYQKAIDYYEIGLEISTEIGGRSGIASNNGNLGSAYLYLGEYQQAIDYYEESLDISTEIGDRSAIAGNNGNLGNAYSNLGEYQKAIDYYNKALEISTEIGDRSGIANNYGNLGSTYSNLGEYQKAIDHYKISLEMSTEIGDRSGIASKNGNLGSAYLRLGKYQEAFNCYQIGLDISTEIGDQLGIAKTNGDLGDAYLSLGEYQKAIDYYEKGLEINTKIGYQKGIAIKTGNLGNAYFCLVEYQKAIDNYEKALEISTEIGHQSGIAMSNANLGYTYFILGSKVDSKSVSIPILQRASGYLEKSVKYSDQMFSGLDVDEDKISFTEEYFKFHKILMCCFILLKRIEAALLVIDLGKAKALHAFLEKRKKSENNMMSDYARKAWERIHNNEEKMQTVEIENIIDLKANNSTALLFSFDHFEILNIWVVNGEDDIKFHSCKESNEMSSLEEYIFDNLKKLLKLFFVNLTRDSSFNKLDSDSTSSEPMIMSTQLVRKLVNDETNSKFREAVSPGDNTPETPGGNISLRPKQHSGNDTREIYNILLNLFRLLIEPIKDWIRGTKLIIVPDKSLFFLPFCALLDENGCRLSENYSIQITPSLHTLWSSIKRSRDSSLGFALFVGNPTVGKVSFRGKEGFEREALPSATEEVKCLALLFEAQPLVEGEATKERVLSFINGAGIIHIAAHGEPERGEIFLSPNVNMTEQILSFPKEDSYLLKQEDIMKIGINARLVVLSCCDTGKGEISSEGVVGLARAFLAAGARSVLATLWPISDGTTKQLMEYFYDEIFKETSVCEALRRSQIKFHSDPIEYWAPFTIYGEDVKFSQCDIKEIQQKSREMSF